jgi:hypothetical protein
VTVPYFPISISLSPGSPSYEAQGPWQTPYALTFVNDPDIWQFDLSAFSPAVNVTVHVNDYYTPYPDDYNLYWDGTLLGNTLTADAGRTFSFSTLNVAHTLTVEYVNQHTGVSTSGGGSYYDMTIAAAPAPVPEPGTFVMMLTGLGVLGWLNRGMKSKEGAVV